MDSDRVECGTSPPRNLAVSGNGAGGKTAEPAIVSERVGPLLAAAEEMVYKSKFAQQLHGTRDRMRFAGGGLRDLGDAAP